MRLIFKVLSLILLVLLFGLLASIGSNLKDRNPGYSVDMKITGGEPAQLYAGFAAVAITPEVPDRWTDANGDAEYHPKDGDSFTDGNGNGKFDPVWIAGMSNSKPANGIHDDIWARTMVLDDGTTRLAIVALDAIGYMQTEVIKVRSGIPAETGITYCIVVSTHNHEGPDMLGLWGKTPFRSGVNKTWMEFVRNQIIRSVVTATGNLRPVRLEISEDPEGAAPLVKDTRMPQVFDSGLRMMKAVDSETGQALGSLIAWADHPETLWSQNLLITSDFPHYFREGVEKGVFHSDSLVKPGIGGIAVFVNGALGGLMTTHPSLAVTDPFTGEEFKEPSFEKAEAQGKQLSLLALDAMAEPVEVIDSGAISLMVKTIILPIKNKLFKLAMVLGVLDRGTTGWMKMRTELAVIQIGPVSIATIPGEIYPELVNGGIEAPEGQDFDIDPLEVPPIRELMPGNYKFILGLANDEIGYIIPKSQWDVKAPYTYDRKSSPYGEENSLGPETAEILHRNIREMVEQLGQN